MRNGKLVTMVMATRHAFLLRIPVSCVVAGDDDCVCVCENKTVVVAVVSNQNAIFMNSRTKLDNDGRVKPEGQQYIY